MPADNTDEQRQAEVNLARTQNYERLARRSMWWCWTWAFVALAALIGVLIVNSVAEGGQHEVCHPADADSTYLWYVPMEAGNTGVAMIAYCGQTSTVWHISFFEGEQPELWDWWEIQNTASDLLRGG